MEVKTRAKGSWGLRFFIIVLSIILGILLYWLLSFVENDIGTMRGPDYLSIRKEYVPESLDFQKTGLTGEIEKLDRKITSITEQQRLLSSSTESLQRTINQLLEIQRESINKNVEFPEYSRKTLEENQSVFLKNQEKYQQYNSEIYELTLQSQQKKEELAEVNEKIGNFEKEAEKSFAKLCEKHRMKAAAVKLAFLVPVFLAISFLFIKYRTGIYWPLMWAAFVSSFLKITMVAHEYFPSRYFKYIAIAVVIGIVIRILLYLIKTIASPKRDLLLKQYQQDYDKCLCPVCSKPIRTGILRYAGCLNKKSVLNLQQGATIEQEPYTCPKCGTTLYNECEGCGKVRHSLLPYCEHCGNEREKKE